VKSNNLKANDRCVVTAEDGDDAVIVEGRAELSELPTGFTEAYRLKYGQTIDAGPIWIVRPTVAFAFQATDDFPKTATRWVFSTRGTGCRHPGPVHLASTTPGQSRAGYHANNINNDGPIYGCSR
jgi:hypothetical protein